MTLEADNWWMDIVNLGHVMQCKTVCLLREMKYVGTMKAICESHQHKQL